MTAIHYRVEAIKLHAHLFGITLTVAAPAAEQVLRLPVWIPGSYLVREFSKNLQNLTAFQGEQAVSMHQLDKASWQLQCDPHAALTVCYEVYAHDTSVRTAWLDATRGFFNGTSMCLQVSGQTQQPHVLELVANAATANWSVATGLSAIDTSPSGFGRYQAPDYDTLVDCPVEMGQFWSGDFTACGIPHRFVVAGAPPSFDGTRLLADTKTICEEEIRFWHGEAAADYYENSSASRTLDARYSPVPYKSYVFLLNAVADGYGGLEHSNSTALICKRQDLPRLGEHKASEGYTTLLGLISHEYFHTWNVKRLRPAELARYDYTQENYTELLWFFEGFTSYYDDLFLRRTELINDATYLNLMAKTINGVAQTPGRKVQTVAQASWDAWVKYYRQDENSPNATISYYTKGSLVALCLDLTLRREGKTSLDAVMRGLWQRCQVGPMSEQDLLAVLEQLGQRSFATELAAWVHSTQDLPVLNLLQAHGVGVAQEPDSLAQQLGMRVTESNNAVRITHVLRDSAAEQAGFASGDEWIAVQTGDPLTQHGAWRLQSLEDLRLVLTAATPHVNALIARDKRLLQLTLPIPALDHNVRLHPQDTSLLHAWLVCNNQIC